jgi:hypothetical protein
LRGGGGNNPFNQDGATLDLSFIGTAGDLSGADTYTLNTNFITPQYQIAAQYAVWESGVGLAQKTFAQIVTFTRGSNATQFDSAGSLVYAPANLLTFSEDFSNAIWTKQSSVSITTNQIVAPDGATTADLMTADAGLGVYQQATVTVGTQVTQSIYIKAGTATAVMFRDDTGAGRHIVVNPTTGVITATSGTLLNSGSISVGNGWYRIYFSYAADTTVVRGILRPDTGTAVTVYIWGAQTNLFPELGGITSSLSTYYPTTTTAYYGPRFDYNPSTLAAQGLLIEEARTNLCLQSADFSTTWSASNVTVTTNAVVSPDGTTNADNVFETTANSEHYVRQNFTGLTANTVHTVSVFVKNLGGRNLRVRVLDTDTPANGYVMTVSPSLGTVTSAATAVGAGASVSGAISAVGNNWYRVTLSGNAGATCTKYTLDFFSYDGATAVFAGDITKGLTLFGAQLELGAFPTSYIPTTTTALTRSADVALVNTLSPWYNATEGTLYAEFTARLNVTQTPVTFSGAAGVGYRIRKSGTNQYVAVLRDGATKDIAITPSPALTEGQIIKVALGVKVNDCALSGGGQAVATQTSFSPMPTITDVNLGFTGTDGFALNGWFRRFTYYPRRLSNADLQAITT